MEKTDKHRILFKSNDNSETIIEVICMHKTGDYFCKWFMSKNPSFRYNKWDFENEFTQIINPDIAKLELQYISKNNIMESQKNILDDRVSVKIDGNLYFIKPLATGLQLKRLAGGDNDLYEIKCLNGPQRWNTDIVQDKETIDLSMPDEKDLEFTCILKHKIN